MDSFVSPRNSRRFQERFRRSVEEREIRSSVCKEFIGKMHELEDELEAAGVVEEPNSVESTKRRRKTMALDMDDILYLPPEEVRRDVQAILGCRSLDVFVEEDALHVENEVFMKGNRVVVVVDGEKHAAIVSLVGEDDVVFKTKEYRRIKISLDNLRLGEASVSVAEDD